VHVLNTNVFSKNTTKNVSNVTYQIKINKINTEVFKKAIKALSWNNILDEKTYNEF
jgi:hypothetical protein